MANDPTAKSDTSESAARRRRAHRRGFATGFAFLSLWIVWHFAMLHAFDLVIASDGTAASAGLAIRIPGADGPTMHMLAAAPGGIGRIELASFAGSARRNVELVVGRVDSFGQFHPHQILRLEGSALTRACTARVDIRDGAASVHACIPHAALHWRRLD